MIVSHRVALIFVAGLSFVFCAAVEADEISYETLALSGEQAPGTDSGTVYNIFFGFPFLNDAGEAAFAGNLTGVDGPGGSGIWSGNSDSPSLVVRQGDIAPDIGSPVFSNLGLVAWNSAGQIALNGFITGSGVDSLNNQGIWSEGGGSLALVAREGNRAPGTGSDILFSSFNTLAFNDAGQVSFYARLRGPGVPNSENQGLWSEGSGTLALVFRAGDAAPGTEAGVVFSFAFGGAPLVMNDIGQTAFFSRLTGAGVDSTNDVGLWSEGSGILALVVREGDAAPGTGPGIVFSNLSSVAPVAFNDAGHIAFHSQITGAGVDSSNNNGIWSAGNGSLELVVRSGDSAPGLESDTVFSSFFENPLLNEMGQIAFAGSISGSDVTGLNNSGIWSEGSGTLALVAREGDDAPGTSSGVVFGNFDSRFLLFNDTGQTAFLNRLSGEGVNASNDRGIWATDSNGLLSLVVREGDLFDVNDDPLLEELRMISLVSSDSGGDFIMPPSFNNNGQLAFLLRFTDGTAGIFLSSIFETIEGDITGDGFVGAADLDILLMNWGDVAGMQALGSGDLSGDGIVGQADLDLLISAWGNGTPPEVNIPTPGSLVILATGALCVLGHRRRA